MSTTLTLTTVPSLGIRGEVSPARERAAALAHAMLGGDTIPDTIVVDGAPFHYLVDDDGCHLFIAAGCDDPHCDGECEVCDEPDFLTLRTDDAGVVVSVSAEFGCFVVTRDLEGVSS